MLNQSFHLLRRARHILAQRPRPVLTEVEDFFERHADAIAFAIKEPDVLHGPYCQHDKRQWLFSWRWPFVRTWISRSICCCEINQIMRQHRETMRLMDEIIEALTPAVLPIDLSELKPETQLAVVRSWQRTQMGQVDIDDIVAILDELKD